jgi:hypothetical protein
MTSEIKQIQRPVSVGGLTLRAKEMDVSNYTGDGEPFGPDEADLRRLSFAISSEVSENQQAAKFDEENQRIRLIDPLGDGELPPGASGRVKILAFGW